MARLSAKEMPTALWGVGAVTALGTLAAVVPYLVSGGAGIGLSVFLALTLFGAAGATWRLSKSTRVESGQEVFLREAFHSVLTPQLITDDKGNLILANRAFRGWIDLGVQQNAEAALAARFSATPAVTNEFNQVKASLQKGHSGIAELPVVRGGKIIEWRRIVSRPLEGYPNYYHWRFDDISERRRMEKAMRDEQAKLIDFMAQAPVGIYSVDQHGLFRFANKTLAEWLQVTPEELIRGDVRLHNVLRDPPKGVAAHAIAAGPQGELRGEAIMRRRDGTLFPVAITQTVVMGDDGKTLRTRSIVRDQSPEREWQQALSVSEHRFQRLFAEAPIGILLIDGKYTVMECNHAFHSIIRRSRGGIVGTGMEELIAPNDRQQMMAKLAEVLGGTDQISPLEVRMLSEREIIAQVFVKRFGLVGTAPAGAEQSGLMLYFIDVTEQKHLQIQFAQSQKMQAIGQLAGGVAHDFNNLLTAMIGFCDLLLQRHKPGDQSFNDIMQIKQNGNRAANLVRQLLAFSRQQTLQPKVLSLADVLSELTNLLRRLIGAQIKLDMIHGRDVGLVKVDQGQLEQVIINLVVNARDAMPSGGTVTIRTRNHRQESRILRGQDDMPPGDYVAIEVKDTGIGIPAENIHHIFEPFFSTKELGSGTGLGLATVYGIVRQTGGFISVDSTVGVGTTLNIYLPVYRQTKGEIEAKPEDVREDKPGPDLTGAGTILLVEDEDAVRVFSSRALRNKGYTVLEARSGEEALAVLNEQGDKVDLIVSDVVMPQMDGPTLYKHMRGKWPKIKVIFVSGYTEDRLREQFTSGEAIHFLPKPFTLKQLAGKVKDVMEEGK
ncbi:MAG: response regulator [Alphaproteobacteria bacterium]|nr:response regulator [Alphaproteobacteria bacterium]